VQPYNPVDHSTNIVLPTAPTRAITAHSGDIIFANTDVIAADISKKSHKHGGILTGGAVSGVPKTSTGMSRFTGQIPTEDDKIAQSIDQPSHPATALITIAITVFARDAFCSLNSSNYAVALPNDANITTITARNDFRLGGDLTTYSAARYSSEIAVQ